MIKTVALFSGGLDSQLAVLLIQEQGVQVYGITFVTPFFTPETAVKAAGQLSLPLEVIDFTEEHFEIVKKPKYGYGKNLNPCIDCHALMVKKAGQYMEEIGAHFIITGEVLGERPKSQNYKALQLVVKESGYEGLVLRPLSAKLLPVTIPEEKGWVDRNRLGSIQGRSRKPQMAMAEKYGLQEYPSPAGGCLLTVQNFSNRLKDLLAHQQEISRADLELLKIGRHFRLGEEVKIIVGRDQEENNKIEQLAGKEDLLLKAVSVPGPTTLYRGKPGEDYLRQAAAITNRYSDAGLKKTEVKVYKTGGKALKKLLAEPFGEEKLSLKRIN